MQFVPAAEVWPFNRVWKKPDSNRWPRGTGHFNAPSVSPPITYLCENPYNTMIGSIHKLFRMRIVATTGKSIG